MNKNKDAYAYALAQSSIDSLLKHARIALKTIRVSAPDDKKRYQDTLDNFARNILASAKAMRAQLPAITAPKDAPASGVADATKEASNG